MRIFVVDAIGSASAFYAETVLMETSAVVLSLYDGRLVLTGHPDGTFLRLCDAHQLASTLIAFILATSPLE